VQIRKSLCDGAFGEADLPAELAQQRLRNRIEPNFRAADGERQLAVVTVVERRVDNVVKRGEPQALRCLKQRKILEMAVAIADQRKENDAAKEPAKVDGGTRGVPLNRVRYIFVGGIVLAVIVAPARLA